MNWSVEATMLVDTDGLDPELLGEHLDELMVELHKLDTEPDVTAALARGLIEIGIVVKAKTMFDAFSQALGTIRCALHAAGAATPDWPTIGDFEEPEEHPDGGWVVKLGRTETRDPKLVDA